MRVWVKAHACVMCLLLGVCLCLVASNLQPQKRSSPTNSIFQGEQGPPGPQGPEEVIEFPPVYLPPKGYKVKAKVCFYTRLLICTN